MDYDDFGGSSAGGSGGDGDEIEKKSPENCSGFFEFFKLMHNNELNYRKPSVLFGLSSHFFQSKFWKKFNFIGATCTHKLTVFWAIERGAVCWAIK